jgi:CubicO group peptidase (beta-lactamase class C family)
MVRMKHISVKILASVTIASCFLCQAVAQQSSQGPDTQAFAREVQAYSRLFKLPGVSIAVVQNGKIVYRQNEGSSDLERHTAMPNDAIFSIASVTKTFTGVMMMQFEQEGKISLEDYLLKYPFDTKLYSLNTVDANTRLKHVLSMTSDGVPGTTFSYNGGRFNYLSGVFDQISQHSLPDSYSQEVSARIFEPLHMSSTFDGYPSQPNQLTTRVVRRYRVEAGKDGAVYTNVSYDSNAAYPAPAAGIFSSIDDLAAYATALDRDILISHAKYFEMTTPFTTNEGKQIPYGFGWLTQQYQGIRLNWAYGEGDFDSALLLRVPERGLTFILLSNSGLLSHASRLNSGNVLRSPFAIAFLRYFVLKQKGTHVDYEGDIGSIVKQFLNPQSKFNPIDYEELLTQALVRTYVRGALHDRSQKPEQLTQLLFQVHPESFDGADIPLMVLMSRIDTKDLRTAAARLIRSFDTPSERRPEALYFIGKYYQAIGDEDSAAKFFERLANESGFIDEGAKIDACRLLGLYYLKGKQTQEGRDYIWRSAQYAHDAGYGPNYISDMLTELGRN